MAIWLATWSGNWIILDIKNKEFKIFYGYKFTNNSYKFNEFWLALMLLAIINKTKPILFWSAWVWIIYYSTISGANPQFAIDQKQVMLVLYSWAKEACWRMNAILYSCNRFQFLLPSALLSIDCCIVLSVKTQNYWNIWLHIQILFLALLLRMRNQNA
jgi:hypothetical protein